MQYRILRKRPILGSWLTSRTICLEEASWSSEQLLSLNIPNELPAQDLETTSSDLSTPRPSGQDRILSWR